jgi:hypothetical protein
MTFALVMGLVLGLAPLTSDEAGAPEVRDTSYVTSTGERVLRIETTVHASVNQVWECWTTSAGLQRWMAPVANIDLRIGGTISTNYSKDARVGDPGTILLKITNYLERELVTLKVTLNDSFPIKTRADDKDLQEIVQVKDMGNGRTKIVSSMVGWGSGKEWDDTYNFFAKGNVWTYRQLAKYLVSEHNKP